MQLFRLYFVRENEYSEETGSSEMREEASDKELLLLLLSTLASACFFNDYTNIKPIANIIS